MRAVAVVAVPAVVSPIPSTTGDSHVRCTRTKRPTRRWPFRTPSSSRDQGRDCSMARAATAASRSDRRRVLCHYRGERRHHLGRSRHCLPGLPIGIGPMERRRRRCARRHGALPQRYVSPTGARQRTQDFHPTRPQPGPQRADRRQRHGVCSELWLTVCDGPGQRPSVCDPRGFPEHRQTRVRPAAPAPLRWHRL